MDTYTEERIAYEDLTLESLDVIENANAVIREEIARDIYDRRDELGVRSVTIKLSFKPDEDGIITTETAIKPNLPAVKTVFDARLGNNKDGEVVLQVPRQLALPGID